MSDDRSYYSPITNQLYPMAPGGGSNDLLPLSYYGDPEAAGTAQASEMMAPAVKSYVSDVVSGRMFEKGLERLGLDQPSSGSPYLTAESPAVNIALGVSGGGSIIQGVKGATAAIPRDLSGPEFMAAQNKVLAPLDKAVALEGSGMERGDIFNQTGWYRGLDDQWRNIIPDENASLKTGSLQASKNWPDMYGVPVRSLFSSGAGSGLRLGDILDHDDLYKSYPWAKDIAIKPVSPADMQSGLLGSFNATDNTIRMAPQGQDDFLSTLLHETQHAVQHYEGFARGGNVSEFMSPTFNKDFLANQNERDSIEREIHNAGYDPRKVAGEHGFYPFDAPVQQFAGHSAGLDPDLVSEYQSATEAHKGLMDQQMDAYKSYANLGGEVESRVVQAMMQNRRWDQPPWESGELRHTSITQPPSVQPTTPESQQILRYYNRTYPQGPYTPTAPNYSLTPVDYDPFANPPGQGQ